MMEQQLKERLVGAAVLVVLTVIFVPMVLDGPDSPSASAPATIAPVPVDASTFGYDLNAPMPGTPAAPQGGAEAATAAAPTATKPAATTTAPSVAPKPAPAMPQTSAPTTSTTAKLAPTPTKPATTTAGTGWAAQVGSFSKDATAKTIADDLKRRGFKAFVMEHREAGKTYYRVRVGPVASREAADALGRKITQQTGQAARPVRHP
jgi:DedD protein